jgi:hypothetical protein
MLQPTEVRAVSAEFLDYSGVIGVFEADFEMEEVSKPEFVELARLFLAAPAMYEALRELMPPENNGWWCPTCRLAVPGQEVTYSEHHTECGTYLGAINNAEWVKKARQALKLAEGRCAGE